MSPKVFPTNNDGHLIRSNGNRDSAHSPRPAEAVPVPSPLSPLPVESGLAKSLELPLAMLNLAMVRVLTLLLSLRWWVITGAAEFSNASRRGCLVKWRWSSRVVQKDTISGFCSDCSKSESSTDWVSTQPAETRFQSYSKRFVVAMGTDGAFRVSWGSSLVGTFRSLTTLTVGSCCRMVLKLRLRYEILISWLIYYNYYAHTEHNDPSRYQNIPLRW
jgi:hypothetical protein